MRTRTVGRLAWGVALLNGVLTASLVAVALSNHVSLPRFVSDRLVSLLLAVGFSVTGAFIATRQPRNVVGWLLLGLPFFDLITALSNDYARHALVVDPGSWPVGPLASWISVWTWVPLVIMGGLLFQLLPNGHPVSRRWRWLVYLTLAEGTFTLIGFMATWPLRGTRLLADVERMAELPAVTKLAIATGFLFLPIFVAAVAAAIVRFARSRGEERQQLKWITLGVSTLGLTTVIGLSLGRELPVVVDASALVVVTVTLAVAILKYRLYDIDLVINKTVVYGTMAAFITAVYIAVVVGIGRAIGSERNLVLSILATAVVAVGFQPVRERVQRVANRLVYGKRATPYEVLSEFSSHAVATDEFLPRMARIVAEGVGAARVDIWLHVGSNLVREASWPQSNGEAPSMAPMVEGEAVAVDGADGTVPVRHQGELLGLIAVQKAPGEALAPAESKLLEDLASQAGLVLRNVRLIEDLKTSRQRLVRAQDEERRRLERNLHDGAQQRIVSIALALRMARGLVPEDKPDLGTRIDEAAEQITLTLSELREFARGIHPAILTERGLVAALRSLAERTTEPVRVEAALDGRVPAPIEAAAYFVVSEALANVSKYAKASSVTVMVGGADGELVVEVADDGIGGVDPSRGSGLRGLSDRVAVVDGRLEIDSPPGQGTRLVCRIPIHVLTEVSS